MKAGDKRAVGEILVIVTGMANGRAGVGVVGIKLKAVLRGEQVPPSLFHGADIVLFLGSTISAVIPTGIGLGRDVATIRGIGIAQHREAGLCHGVNGHTQQEEQAVGELKSFHW